MNKSKTATDFSGINLQSAKKKKKNNPVNLELYALLKYFSSGKANKMVPKQGLSVCLSEKEPLFRGRKQLKLKVKNGFHRTAVSEENQLCN